MTRLLAVILLLFACAGSPSAQTEGMERIPFRVTSVLPGGVAAIDRGRADGVELGDLARLELRDGRPLRARVTEVEERSATIELEDSTIEISPGVRGVVLVPASRFAEEEAPEPEPEPVEVETQPEVSEPTKPAWENKDEDWKPGQPLLSSVRAVRPEKRARSIHGRFYLAGHDTYSTEDERSDLFLRTGADVRAQNPFGRGGSLRIDGELKMRQLSVPDDEDDNDTFFRLDRLSYRSGGTRFNPTSWEAGRFLQGGVPEFGVLDGYQWMQRRRSGDRYGVSVGYLPEPDRDYETGSDLQVAAFYRWTADPRELFTATAGFQKTWHNGRPDRDLLLSKVHYVTERGWDLHGATWIDWYSGGDEVKSGVELTQAIFSATKRRDDGSGVDYRFRRWSIPEIERNEFLPVGVQELRNGVYDRLSASWWTGRGPKTRVETELGVWRDEDDEGGDAEFLYGIPLEENRELRLVTFGTVGSFTWQLGGRIGYSGVLEEGRWDMFYEVADHHLAGFSDNRDDLIQHRLHASRDVRFGSDWTLSLALNGLLYDEDGALTVGVTLQRSF